MATLKGQSYRLPTPDEESRCIDGYIGDIPVSIKPTTYKAMDMLVEKIDAKMIYYEKDEKKKDGIWVNYDF